MIVVGVCGSIAAYKAAILVRRLVARGATVHVIMTPAAARFIGPVTLRALSHRPVLTDMWAGDAPWDEPHVALGEMADLFVIAPASADMLGRLAAGLADDLVCATALATRAPVLLAPAMSEAMVTSPVVADNLSRLRSRGMHVMGPERGPLASGKIGLGRMAEPETILAAVETLIGSAAKKT